MVLGCCGGEGEGAFLWFERSEERKLNQWLAFHFKRLLALVEGVGAGNKVPHYFCTRQWFALRPLAEAHLKYPKLLFTGS